MLATACALVSTAVVPRPTNVGAQAQVGAMATVVPAGEAPIAIALDDERSRAFFLAAGDNRITVFDWQAGQVVGAFPAPPHPSALAFRPMGSTLYVTSYSEGEVVALDATTGATRWSALVGPNPYAVAVDHRQNRLYVTNAGEATISVLDASSGQPVATIATGPLPYGVVADPSSGRAYFTTRGDDRAHVLDGTTNKVLSSEPVAWGPVDLAVDPTHGRVFVSGMDADALTVLSLDGEVVGRVPVASLPFAVAASVGGDRVYVTSIGSSTVQEVDPVCGTVPRSFPVGRNPVAAAVDAASRHLFVANADDGTVTLITLPPGGESPCTPSTSSSTTSSSSTTLTTSSSSTTSTTAGSTSTSTTSTSTTSTSTSSSTTTVPGGTPNLVKDPSFEPPGVPAVSSFSSYGPPATRNLGAWTIAGGGVDVVGPDAAVAADGKQFLDLNGNGFGKGVIYQDVATTAGHRYRVSLRMAGNPNGPPVRKTLAVDFADASETFTFDTTGHSNQALGWTEMSFVAPACLGATSRVTLRSLTESSEDRGPNVDLVSVVDTAESSAPATCQSTTTSTTTTTTPTTTPTTTTTTARTATTSTSTTTTTTPTTTTSASTTTTTITTTTTPTTTTPPGIPQPGGRCDPPSGPVSALLYWMATGLGGDGPISAILRRVAAVLCAFGL